MKIIDDLKNKIESDKDAIETMELDYKKASDEVRIARKWNILGKLVFALGAVITPISGVLGITRIINGVASPLLLPIGLAAAFGSLWGLISTTRVGLEKFQK